MFWEAENSDSLAFLLDKLLKWFLKYQNLDN